MIVMSGFYTNSSKTACDSPSIGGQHSLLLGQESVEKGNVWRALMPDVVEYRVPSNITVVIGGGYVSSLPVLVQYTDELNLTARMAKPH
jgi:hypothetical protein